MQVNLNVIPIFWTQVQKHTLNLSTALFFFFLPMKPTWWNAEKQRNYQFDDRKVLAIPIYTFTIPLISRMADQCISTNNPIFPDYNSILSASISRRLTDISSNEQWFSDASPLYENALREREREREIGHSEGLKYLAHRKTVIKDSKRMRQWEITCTRQQECQTNSGHIFLQLVDKHYPKGPMPPYTLKCSTKTT